MEKERNYKWYTLHVQSGFEDIAKENLIEVLTTEGLIDKVKEIFIPARMKALFYTKRKKVAEVPLDEDREREEVVVENDQGKKTYFTISDKKVWIENCECKTKKCLSNPPISKPRQKLKCSSLRNRAQIELRDKLFPGYIFINCDLDEKLMTTIKYKVPRVLDFVRAGNEPLEVSEKEIQAIKDKLKKGIIKVSKKSAFEVGEKVRIKEGPFVGFEGVIDKIDPETGKVRVLVNIFDRQTPVELTVDQIERVI